METSNQKIKVFVSLSEISADLLFSQVIDKLEKRHPSKFEYAGLCGGHCEKRGVKVIYDITHRSAIGIEESLKFLVFYLYAFWKGMRYIHKNKVDLLVCVDSSGFNLFFNYMAKKFFKIKSAYYIPPHITLLGRDQIRSLKHFDLQLYTFKMDYELASRYLDNARFVGHVFSNLQRQYDKMSIRKDLGLDEKKKTIALFPGSRSLEIKGLLRPYIEVLKLLKKEHGDIQAVLALSHKRFLYPIKEIAGKDISEFTIIEGRSDDVMKAADFCFCALGTANLQGVLYKTPMAICYRYSPIFHYISKKGAYQSIFFSIPNILLGEEIIREFINEECTVKNVYNYAKQIIGNEDYQKMYNGKSDIIADKLRIENQDEYIVDSIYGLVAEK